MSQTLNSGHGFFLLKIKVCFSKKKTFVVVADEIAVRSDVPNKPTKTNYNLQKAASLNNLPDEEFNDIADEILAKLNIEHADNKMSLYDKKKLKWASDTGVFEWRPN